MKLLNPLQLKQNKDAEIAREILRTKDVREANEQVRKELAKSQIDFNDTLAKNRTKWAQEEKEHTERVREMTGEIEKLEEKKAQALIPVKMYEEQAKQLIKTLEERSVMLAQKEQFNDDLTERLHNKLDEVGQREQDVTLRERKATALRLELGNQLHVANERTATLNGQIRAFLEDIEIKKKDIEKRKTEVTLREQTISSKEESLKRTEKTLDDWAKKLADERATLDRIYQRENPKISP